MNWWKRRRRNKNISSGWKSYNTQSSRKSFFSGRFRKSFIDKKAILNFNNRFKIKEIVVKFFINIAITIVVANSKIKNREKKLELIDRTYERIGSRDFKFIPISTAFYLFLSFIPIIFFTTLIIIAVDSISENFVDIMLTDIVDKVIPGLKATITSIFSAATGSEEINLNALKTIFNDPSRVFGFVVLLMTLIWFSSTGYVRLIYSMSYIYDHNNYGNGLLNRLKAIYMLVFIIFYITLGFMIFIPIARALQNWLGSTSASYIAIFNISLLVFVIIFYYLGLLLLLRFTPKFKLKFQHLQPGIFISLIPLVLLTTTFQLIIGFSSFNQLGVFAAIFFIATFVSFFSYFLYTGIIANEAYYKTFYGLRTVNKITNRRGY